MKKSFRLLAVAATAALSAMSVAMFAGCTTQYPEVTITYTFNGQDYEVEYTLSRTGAPQTVQHFIELADAGYYNGTVIHDYQPDGTFLYGGGYVYNEDGELVEKDYFTELRRYEEENDYQFTQTVYASGRDMRSYFIELQSEGRQYVAGGVTYGEENEKIPLYTLHGEFENNGVAENTKTYSHAEKGVLAMYYTDKGDDNDVRVGTIRTDGGAGSDDENEYQEGDKYKTNCATSIFYTFTSSGRSDLDANYSAFGKVKDFSQMQALLTAVSNYTSEHNEDADGDGNSFTTTESMLINQFDPIDLARSAKISVEYNVPIEPITIKSVKVTKY